MSSARPPSYGELAALAVELRLPVSAQAEMLVEQAGRIAELERQVGSDSHSSSRPPSRDGLRKKPAPKSLRKRSGRKPGRAKGDPGGQLAPVVDGHFEHRSKKVRDRLADHADETEPHHLSPYPHRRNLDELVNADLKHSLPKSHRFFRRRQRRPHIARGDFHGPTSAAPSTRTP
ncbi:DUF6444 domain-containing protein [Streptomyces scopuliridis]|uniref:DUF6444 domain-containing protein n=1 Tax=Streptomyces scopuliridis TaxID=452529 RepID=UPI00343FCB7A